MDLTISDIARDPASTLDPNMTAANFGDLSEDATPADLAAGAVNLVLQAIGTMTVLACQSCHTDTVIVTGSMTTLDQAEPNFAAFEKLYGIHYVIPGKAPPSLPLSVPDFVACGRNLQSNTALKSLH